ncbi:Heme oxygenase [Cognatishimia maritima]|uniref:Heme oxygenase n=1 Tax=Cognatishimia maritima TaxID=870908 RepID=A0A1M5PM44_9RHOB|nr:Heme oxygenase [Cognatishimia maritima]
MGLQGSLRLRLRAETRRNHDLVDANLAPLVHAGATGFRQFLLFQWRFFSAIEQRCDDASCALIVHDMLNRLNADLRSLGLCSPRKKLSFQPNALAIDYLVIGSRLGAKVLKRQWLDTALPEVSSAKAFLNAPDYVSFWREFVARTEKMPATGKFADEVVIDCIALFEFCLSCVDSEPARGRAAHV